jgi:hypothetical protein
MSGLTWGKPVQEQGAVALYRRAMSYGGTSDQIEWMVADHVVTGAPINSYREFSLKREAVAWFNFCVEQEERHKKWLDASRALA